MIIKEINGSLLDSKSDILVHQTNCFGCMGSGVAKAIKDKYPKVYKEYNDYVFEYKHNINKLLGTVCFASINNDNSRFIANLFGQKNYGYDGKRYTSYDAVYDGLIEVKKYTLEHSFTSIAFPYGMSSVRGGANWNIIYKMIEEVFKDTDLTIEIWKL